MQFTDDQKYLTLLAILTLLTLYGFVVSGPGIILYAVFASGAVYLYYYLNEKKEDQSDVENRRLAWLLTKLSPLNPNLRYDLNAVQQILPNPDNNQIEGIRMAELGITTFEVKYEHKLVDLSQAEIEITKLEERASIILGSLVFIPIIFALMHLFREVDLPVFLTEIYVALLLGYSLIETQKRKYNLTGWEKIYNFLIQSKEALISNPRQLLLHHQLTMEWFQSQKIGFDKNPTNLTPASYFLYIVCKFIIQLDADLRGQYLNKILEEIENLPGKEEIVEEKWEAYKTRLFLISISSTALAGLFASISAFNINLLSTESYQLETTEYLVWGEYFIVLILNMLVLNLWYDRKKIIFYGIILSIVFFAFYFMNSLLI